MLRSHEKVYNIYIDISVTVQLQRSKSKVIAAIHGEAEARLFARLENGGNDDVRARGQVEL